MLSKTPYPLKFIQGPLAGISTAPFRKLVWKYSQPVCCYTEMISCKTIIHQSAIARRRFLVKDKAEGPLSFQLAASDVTELAEATKIVTQHGADFIDLNCGCPVKKIRSKGAGSSLLAHPTKLYQLIKTMKDNTHVPISIKIRVDNHNEKFNEAVAKVINEAGADFLVVHGRHWTEHYDKPCRYEAIKYFVENVKIPVIGNGDIACNTSLTKMLATGCAGIMIARAGVGQPWLINKLIAEFENKPFIKPEAKLIGEMLLEHVNGLVELLGNEFQALLQARKFAKYYARHIPNKTDFSTVVNQCKSLSEIDTVIRDFFKD